MFFISSCKPFCLEAGNGHLPAGRKPPNSHVLFRKQRKKKLHSSFLKYIRPLEGGDNCILWNVLVDLLNV